ncbi:MAG TPA: hypothetical protein VFD58_35020 [Blastocatellia bacterium]|nr:hypothetical protein [Blastocatellia bacterium]
MGVILCRKHGKTGMTFICPHLHQDIFQDQQLRDYDNVKFSVFDTGEEVIYPLCKDCIARYGFRLDFGQQLKWEDWFEDLKIEPRCGKCFSEYKGIQ